MSKLLGQHGGLRCRVYTDGWCGRIQHDGEIVGETPFHYRILFDRDGIAPGRRANDGSRYVPKKHVTVLSLTIAERYG